MQVLELGVAVLRLISRKEDGLAGLALMSSIRKRLMNLPGDLAANESLQARNPSLTCAVPNRLLLLRWVGVKEPLVSCAAPTHTASRYGTSASSWCI